MCGGVGPGPNPNPMSSLTPPGSRPNVHIDAPAPEVSKGAPDKKKKPGSEVVVDVDVEVRPQCLVEVRVVVSQLQVLRPVGRGWGGAWLDNAVTQSLTPLGVKSGLPIAPPWEGGETFLKEKPALDIPEYSAIPEILFQFVLVYSGPDWFIFVPLFPCAI